MFYKLKIMVLTIIIMVIITISMNGVGLFQDGSVVGKGGSEFNFTSAIIGVSDFYYYEEYNEYSYFETMPYVNWGLMGRIGLSNNSEFQFSLYNKSLFRVSTEVAFSTKFKFRLFSSKRSQLSLLPFVGLFFNYDLESFSNVNGVMTGPETGLSLIADVHVYTKNTIKHSVYFGLELGLKYDILPHAAGTTSSPNDNYTYEYSPQFRGVFTLGHNFEYFNSSLRNEVFVGVNVSFHKNSYVYHDYINDQQLAEIVTYQRIPLVVEVGYGISIGHIYDK